MPTLIRSIEDEIAAKGKAYLILETVDESDAQSVLQGIIARVREQGAAEIFLSSGDPSFPLHGDSVTVFGFHLAFETDFWILEKPLPHGNMDSGSLPLHIKRLADWNLALFLALYNASFFAVPNSRTYLEKDGEELLQDRNRQAGFLMEGGVPVGIFELRREAAAWEIASIAISKEHRGRGLGRAALQLLERRILTQGGTRCRVLCAQTNCSAMALYESSGYQRSRLLSSWYRLCPEEI